MAKTDQVRTWYHETISNHNERGRTGYKPDANWVEGVTMRYVEFPRAGGVYREPVHIKTVDAFLVYTQLMRDHGVEMSPAGGVDHARNIGKSNWPSLHAYLVAVDLPPNRYKPQEFQDAVLALRCNDGTPVFRNLASINDRMHDQIDAPPTSLATGIAGYTNPPGDTVTYTPPPDLTDDEGEPFVEAWKWGWEVGMVGPDTQATDVVEKQELIAMFHRYHHNVAPTPPDSDGITKAEADDRYAPITHPHKTEGKTV